jgi:para-nitrobenzyl esterase
MRSSLLFVVVAVAGVVCASVRVVATTTHGPVIGLDQGTHRRWMGIPFARPPVGPLRFQPPQPPTPWFTAVDATNMTVACAQSHSGPDTATSNKSEDCLYINLWAPPAGKYGSAPAAIMIFFYGGDFKEGANAFPVLEGRHIASTSNTIVVVPNYRLGALGFLFVNGGNFGILDQQRAIAWTHSNAAAFGGDRNRITIFGQSAGGQSVLVHLTEPAAPTAPMIRGAIVESGPINLVWKMPPEATLLADAFAALLGCNTGTPLPDLACLCNATTAEVIAAGDQAIVIPLSASSAIQRWAPVLDGSTITGQTIDHFANGHILNVPLAIGSNEKDGMLFSWAIAGGKPMGWAEYAGIVLGIFQSDFYPAILATYPPDFGGDNRPILSELLTDFFMTCTARFTARAAEKAGNTNTFLYRFTHKPPFKVWPHGQSYCNFEPCHGSELPYVFYDSGAPFPWNLTAADRSLGLAMSTFWSTFAATGAPGAGWPVYRNATDQSIEFDWPITTVTGLRREQCDFLDRVGYVHGFGKI